MTEGRSNDEIYRLLDRSMQLMEAAALDVKERATRQDFERLEKLVAKIADTIENNTNGLVLRVDRLEQRPAFDESGFDAKIKEIVQNTMKVSVADLWKIAAALGAGLAGAWQLISALQGAG